MRTAILLIGTVILLAGGFAAYWAAQRPDPSGGAADRAASFKPQPVQQTETTYTVRGGKNVWLKEFDDSRRLTTQFRAQEFNPQKEGFVRVTKPEAHFFLRGGQWIRVTGETGDVVVAGLPEQGSDPFAGAGGGGAGAPSRGRLQDVRIQLYETAGATAPTLDMEMPNAAFDNESFRIFTEGYTDAAGQQVPADQVKVTVRGKYEFDGRGLTIRWNDRDRRLELLEIAHGERLVVKEPGALGTKMPGTDGRSGKKSGSAGEKRAPAPSPEEPDRAVPAGRVASATLVPEAPVTAASADPASAAGAVASTRPADSTIYSIWFYDNVQVVQAEKTLATAHAIEVFYAMRETPEARGAAPAPAPVGGGTAKPQAAGVPADAGGAATQPAATQQAAPLQQEQPTAERQQPVVVYWTGKLRIVPAATEPPAPLAAGQSAVQMRGAPVVLTSDNVQIRCPAFTYRTADGGITLNNSEAFPNVEIEQYATPERAGKPELTLFSERVDYAPEGGTAKLIGKSRAAFPADEGDPTGELAEVTWTREGVARFTGSGRATVIQSLDLTGDVDVQHPQVALQSKRLNLAFDPPAAGPAGTEPAADPADANRPPTTAPSRQPVVRKVVAEGAVHCVMMDADGAPRELHGEYLDIATAADPAGKLYPKLVNARGDVRALQEKQELTAQELSILLKPAAAKPAMKPGAALAAAGKGRGGAGKALGSGSGVELHQLTAKTNVKAVSEKGDVATGNTLVVTLAPDGRPQVGLAGKPAKVTDAKGTVLTSERIVVLGGGDEAQALGPGTLHAVVASEDAGAPPRHMNVAWNGSALLNGKLPENQVQVAGQVKATMAGEKGEVNTASADRIFITLVDAPAHPAGAAPAPKNAKRPPAEKTTEKPADKKADAGLLGSADLDVMKGKQVGRILLNKDAVVDSRLSAADGSVLREMRIDSSQMHYTMQTRRLVVPRAGRMLVRDHRPPEPKAAAETDGLGSERGATAFQWADSLDYNGLEKRAAMRGQVLVAYKPDEPGAPPVQLRADEVVTTFEDAPAGAAAPPRAPAKDRPDATMPGARLRSVRAEGNVNVVRGNDELTAPRLTYDPLTHWIRAVGSPDVPAVYSPGGPGNSTAAREFQWNTQTWKMRVIDAAGRAAASGR